VRYAHCLCAPPSHLPCSRSHTFCVWMTALGRTRRIIPASLVGLYSLRFLHIQDDPNLMLPKAVVSLIGVLCAGAVGVAWWRRQYNWSSTPFVFLSLTWAGRSVGSSR